VTEGFSIEALNSAHNRKGRKGFSSGVEPLDRYFRELVMQDVKRRASNCFVRAGWRRRDRRLLYLCGREPAAHGIIS
jgi:hypothetical protein